MTVMIRYLYLMLKLKILKDELKKVLLMSRIEKQISNSENVIMFELKEKNKFENDNKISY